MSNAQPDIRAIFCEVLDHESPEETAEYLDAVCGDDRELRAQITALIDSHREAGNFLGGDLWEKDCTAANDLIEQPGTLIGRFKLLELIGEGGFAVVYMAEQQEPVRRQVALKIIKLGMDTRQVIARFEAERQALAMMDHPNIAKVHDAGATETGRPYFVMQLIRGVPITEYCDTHRLTIEGRLSLFLDICHAVQHAHQKGIIHRDIKPTNVLLALHDGRPVPKIIDFGIAKATHQRLTEKTLYTNFRQIIGTPQYMSPEQAEFSDLDIDTRTDIYSLGVLLYELLTGTTPIPTDELREMGYDEICRTIRERDPSVPSSSFSTLRDAETKVAHHRHVSLPGLQRQLRGDLDWIVMKALEKDRRRRYATADAMALDIQRHLADEPVHARRPSVAYRLKKLIRKHRLPLAAVVAVLLIGLGLATVSVLRINRERLIATKERDRAEDNLDHAKLLISDVLALDAMPGAADVNQVKQSVLERAFEFYERLGPQNENDPRSRLEVARLCNQLAYFSWLTGENRDRVGQRSVSMMEQLVSEFPSDPACLYELAISHRYSSMMCSSLLRYREALGHRLAAERILQSLVDRYPAESRYRDLLITIQRELGLALSATGDLDDAEVYFRAALIDPARAEAVAHQQFAYLLMSQNRFDEAEEQLGEALVKVRERIPASEWESPSRKFLDGDMHAFWIANALNGSGQLSYQLGKLKQAESQLREAAEIGQELPTVAPHTILTRFVLAQSYYHLSQVLILQGRLKEAEAAALESIRSWGKPKLNKGLLEAAVVHLRVGELLHRTGRIEEARSHFAQAAAVLEKISNELPDEAYCQTRFILLLANCPDPTFRDPGRAVQLAKRVITDANGPLWQSLSLAQYGTGAWQDAVSSIRHSLDVRAGGDALDWLLLAMALRQLDESEEALAWYTRAEEAIAAQAPIRYEDIGVLGFERLREESEAIFAEAEKPPGG